MSDIEVTVYDPDLGDLAKAYVMDTYVIISAGSCRIVSNDLDPATGRAVIVLEGCRRPVGAR